MELYADSGDLAAAFRGMEGWSVGEWEWRASSALTADLLWVRLDDWRGRGQPAGRGGSCLLAACLRSSKCAARSASLESRWGAQVTWVPLVVANCCLFVRLLSDLRPGTKSLQARPMPAGPPSEPGQTSRLCRDGSSRAAGGSGGSSGSRGGTSPTAVVRRAWLMIFLTASDACFPQRDGLRYPGLSFPMLGLNPTSLMLKWYFPAR